MVISSSTDNLQHESNILTQRLSRVCSGHANNEGECLSSRTNSSVLLPAGMLMRQQNLNDRFVFLSKGKQFSWDGHDP